MYINILKKKYVENFISQNVRICVVTLQRIVRPVFEGKVQKLCSYATGDENGRVSVDRHDIADHSKPVGVRSQCKVSCGPCNRQRERERTSITTSSSRYERNHYTVHDHVVSDARKLAQRRYTRDDIGPRHQNRCKST